MTTLNLADVSESVDRHGDFDVRITLIHLPTGITVTRHGATVYQARVRALDELQIRVWNV